MKVSPASGLDDSLLDWRTTDNARFQAGRFWKRALSWIRYFRVTAVEFLIFHSREFG